MPKPDATSSGPWDATHVGWFSARVDCSKQQCARQKADVWEGYRWTQGTSAFVQSAISGFLGSHKLACQLVAYTFFCGPSEFLYDLTTFLCQFPADSCLIVFEGRIGGICPAWFRRVPREPLLNWCWIDEARPVTSCNMFASPPQSRKSRCLEHVLCCKFILFSTASKEHRFSHCWGLMNWNARMQSWSEKFWSSNSPLWVLEGQVANGGGQAPTKRSIEAVQPAAMGASQAPGPSLAIPTCPGAIESWVD